MIKIMSNHSQKTIKATLWSAFGVYTNRFLALGIAAVLSRLLTPEDFGTIAMVTVISGFMSIFADAGIGSAVVQFRDFKIKEHQSLFSLSLLLGLVLAGLLAFGSSFVAVFFDNPDLQQVAAVMALAFPFSTLGIVPRGMLQREMRFREVAVVNVAAAFIAGLIGIVMAFTGWGYWALVVQTLTNSFLSSLSFLVLAKLAPIPRWNVAVIRKIFGYSGNLTLFSTINYWARNLDNLLIGKFIGSAPLGFYNRAYQLMMLPLSMLSSVITPVLHSALAEKQNDIPAMYRGYRQVIRLIALVSIPGMSFAVIMAPELIRVVWGDQWDQTIPIFAILGLNGIFQPIMSTTGTVFLARNKAHWLFRCGIVSTILYCSGIVLGLPYGIVGVAAGYTIASNMFVLPLMFFIFVKLLHGKFMDFIKAIQFPCLFSILFSPVAYGLAYVIRQNLADIFVLVVVFFVSFIVYFAALFLFEKDYFYTGVRYIPFLNKYCCVAQL
jgi:PST family polysaccharide transporter